MKRITSQVPAEAKNNNDLNCKEIVEFYEYKVNYLETNLRNLKANFKGLKNELINSEADKEYILNQKNKIIMYLNQELNNKTNEIQSLNLRIKSFNASKQFDQKKLEDILKNQEATYKEKIEELVHTKIQLEAKLSNVENFIEEKLKLEEKLKDCLCLIENLKEENHQNINEIEKEKLVEKKKLKKELIERLDNLVKEFRSAFCQQINDATKKIVRENHKLRTNIKKITETSNNLLKECENLREKQNENKAEIDYLLKSEEQLSLKNATSTKIIQMYMEKDKINDEENDTITKNNIKIRELKDEIFRLENQFIMSKNKTKPEEKHCDCEYFYDKQFKCDQFKLEMMEKV